jgi:hypothetical protein
MSFLKPLALVVLSISGLLANPAFANCTGSGNFYSCYDARSGNSYNVQKYGNSTSVQGYNPGTGNSWSQQSYNYGNTTNTYGTASNGSSWNQTTTPYGTYGTDSRGNSFYAPRR